MFVLNQRHFDAYESVTRWRFNCDDGRVKREQNQLHARLKTQHNVSNSHRFNVTTASIYTAQRWYLLCPSHVSSAENLYLPQTHRQENNTEFQSDAFRISHRGDLTRFNDSHWTTSATISQIVEPKKRKSTTILTIGCIVLSKIICCFQLLKCQDLLLFCF